MAMALTPSYQAWIALNHARIAAEEPRAWAKVVENRLMVDLGLWLAATDQDAEDNPSPTARPVAPPALSNSPTPLGQAMEDFLMAEGWTLADKQLDMWRGPAPAHDFLSTGAALRAAELAFTTAWFSQVAMATDEQARQFKADMERQALERERDMRRGRHRRGRERRRRSS